MNGLASARRVAALLFAIGLVIGSLIDVVPLRTPMSAGGYWVLAGDFHVHAFPGDGALGPWLLRDEARRAGIDVLAVTNHNMISTARVARWLSTLSPGPIVIAGQEITSPGYHLIAVGLEHTVRADQPAESAIADIHSQGGVAIAAHPTRSFRGWTDAAIARLDGTEAAHPVSADADDDRSDFAAFLVRARALNPHVSPIGSSDFHVAPELAECRTLIFAREPTAAGVLEAIRHGRTVAEDDAGRRFGDPQLVQLLESRAPDGRIDAHPIWRRVAVAFAWVGMFGMLVCRSARGRPLERAKAELRV